jgi:hypothetical protein
MIWWIIAGILLLLFLICYLVYKLFLKEILLVIIETNDFVEESTNKLSR